MWYQILYHFFREMQAGIRKNPRFSAEKCVFPRFSVQETHTRIAHVRSEGKLFVPRLTFSNAGLYLGYLYQLDSAAFRLRANPDWEDFRWLHFKVATLKSSCIVPFARLLKIHPTELSEVPFW